MRLRCVIWLVSAACAVALSGCGDGSEQTSQQALLPRGLATDLAAKSEAIAGALDAGDECGAANLADELKDAVAAAISAGQVPDALQEDLESTAVDLQNSVNCPPPEKHDKGKGEDKGEKKGHDDSTTEGAITLETTTDND